MLAQTAIYSPCCLLPVACAQRYSSEPVNYGFEVTEDIQTSVINEGLNVVHYRTTGTVNPKPHGGGAKPKLDGNFDSLIQHKIQQKPDILLCELCEYE